jgi:hypothetical protein
VFFRASNDDADPVLAGIYEERRRRRTGHLGTGTLACPQCDAPVALATGPVTPATPLSCPFCLHAGAVRDFLSLAPPSRPARVELRVIQR